MDLCNDPKPVEVGERVFCTVSAIRSWMIVTAVKGTRRSLRLKTDSYTGWGYGHNFTRTPEEWMLPKAQQ